MKWEEYKMETLGEREKRNKDMIEKSEVIRENTEKNMRIMKAPDGHTFVTHINWQPKQSLYGEVLMTDGEATPEEIEIAKDMILDRICECIRNVAKRKPDEFFIVKAPEKSNQLFDKTSVAAKFILHQQAFG